MLDSNAPKRPLSDFTSQEARFAMLTRAHPAEAAILAERAQRDVDERRHLYEQLARIDHEVDNGDAGAAGAAGDATGNAAPDDGDAT